MDEPITPKQNPCTIISKLQDSSTMDDISEEPRLLMEVELSP